MKRLASHAAAIAGLVSCLAMPAAAQDHRARVRGIVLDPSRAPVASAPVRVVNEATSEGRETATDAGGRFAVPELAPGTYRIEIAQPGFGPFVARTELVIDQEYRLTAILRLGTVVQAVDVTSPFAPLERSSPVMRVWIDSEQVTGLPLDGRNVLELSLLAPGTQPAAQGSASSVRGDFAFSVNGAREDFNAFLLDGVANVDPKLGTPGVRPAADAVREFEVLTSTYDASFGRNAGGQVNVVTRSGSNRTSGTAYEFLRNGSLDGRNRFAPTSEPAPDYSRHQFGGSIGGAVARNRAFYFGDYEGTRLREGITRLSTVPTPAERRGDFSQSARRPVNPATGQPFANGQLPFLHPVGQAIAALYPSPNRSDSLANFVSSPTLDDDVNQFDVRVDGRIRGGGRLTARYSFSDRQLLEPFAGAGFASVPGFGTDLARRGQNLGVTLTDAYSPTLVNDLRFGYSRTAIRLTAENQAITNASVGLPTFGTNPRDAGLSVISVSGFSPLGDDYTTPQESATDSFQIADTVTWSRGAHLLKLGGEWSTTRQDAFRDVQARGFLNFVDRGFTGNALADLLLGLPVLTGGATLDNPQRLRAGYWGVFVHDDWRVTPSLSLSAGMRYDYAAPPVDADDRANLYDPATSQLVALGDGLPRGGYRADRNNIAPRAGFAWALDQESTHVLRGGYGIYYNAGALATSEGLYFNPPFFNLRAFFPLPGLPQPTLSDPFPASFPALPQSATAYQRDLETPWMEHWSIGLQRQHGRRRTIEVAYVGSRGHDLISARDVNQAAAGVRPNPGFADITLIESRASSRYHALQVKVYQRAAGGVSLLTGYTLAKATDDASGFFTSAGDPNFPQNSLDPAAERGRSAFDIRHRLTTSFAWELPVGKGRAFLSDAGWFSAVLADLELQGIAMLQSGAPFTVALLPEVDNSNTGRSNLGFGFNDRPNVTGTPALSNPRAERWFDTSAFSLPAFGTFGNSGRNTITGPRYRTLDVALVKHVRFDLTRDVQLRLEAFNLFDASNYNLPDNFFGSPTFGQILSAKSPRRVQFAVRAVF